MPSTLVYLVLPSRMALIAASLMLSGVSKSGSPAARPMMSRPAAFGREGMSVMLADIEGQALQAAVEGLRAKQIRAEGVVTDVTSRDAVRRAALETIAKFGKVHVVCNNAGIGAGGQMGMVPERDW